MLNLYFANSNEDKYRLRGKKSGFNLICLLDFNGAFHL